MEEKEYSFCGHRASSASYHHFAQNWALSFSWQRGGFCVPSRFRKIPSEQRTSCNRRTRRCKYHLTSLKSTSRIVERKELIQSILLGRFGSVLFTEGLLSSMCIYLLERWASRIYIYYVLMLGTLFTASRTHMTFHHLTQKPIHLPSPPKKPAKPRETAGKRKPTHFCYSIF